MAGGVTFANASIIMQGDAHLLTRKRIRDMATADDRATCLRVLAECGYQTDFDDDDALLDAARAQTMDTFSNLCEDPALLSCVRAINQLTEANATETFALLAVQIPRIKTPSIRTYLTTWVDLVNVRNFYKGSQTVFPGGNLTADNLDIFPHQTSAQREAACRARLDALGAVDKDDIFQPNPLFWWYLQREKELIIIKALLISKRFHYDVTWLRENLRGLYEQFQ
ncbi:MAG: hypothetical protein NC133_00705 [Prevotella sp.]|nr:hypothetical protein [Prevotella sp.]